MTPAAIAEGLYVAARVQPAEQEQLWRINIVTNHDTGNCERNYRHSSCMCLHCFLFSRSCLEPIQQGLDRRQTPTDTSTPE